MRKQYVGLNLLDRVMKAGEIKDMMRIMKPYLSHGQYKMLCRAVRCYDDYKGKRDCIIRYAKAVMKVS